MKFIFVLISFKLVFLFGLYLFLLLKMVLKKPILLHYHLIHLQISQFINNMQTLAHVQHSFTSL